VSIVSLLLIAAAAVAAPAPSILGEWRGTSTCVDRVFAPACKDEVVVYRFTAGARDTVHLAAFKIVSGEEQFMGALDFTRSGPGPDWSGDFRNARVHIRWRYHLAADTLITGELIDVPTGKRVRRARVTRAASR
jgi:hypothetical protein